MKRRRRSATERLEQLEYHGRVCHICGDPIDPVRERWVMSHDRPLWMGGADDRENTKPAHEKCHIKLTAEVDLPRIAKTRRMEAAYLGARQPSKRPMPGSRNTPWKRTMRGQAVRRPGW